MQSVSSFANKLQASRVDNLFKIQATDQDGRPCWYYVLVDNAKAAMFEKQMQGAENIDLKDYGKILIAGWGETIPSKVAERIKKEGAAFEMVEFEYQSKLFFLKSEHEGRKFYTFIMVPRFLSAEFQYMCTLGNFEYTDYGSIIFSDWGLPDKEVIEYMKLAYNFNPCGMTSLYEDA